MKIILNAENSSGLGVKTKLRKDKQGQNAHEDKIVQNST